MEFLQNILIVLGGIFGYFVLVLIVGMIFGDRGRQVMLLLLVAIALLYPFFFPISAEFYQELRYFKP